MAQTAVTCSPVPSQKNRKQPEVLAYWRAKLQLVGVVVQQPVELLGGRLQGRELGHRSCQLCFQYPPILDQLGTAGCYGLIAAEEQLILILPHQRVPEPAGGDSQPEV